MRLIATFFMPLLMAATLVGAAAPASADDTFRRRLEASEALAQLDLSLVARKREAADILSEAASTLGKAASRLRAEQSQSLKKAGVGIFAVSYNILKVLRTKDKLPAGADLMSEGIQLLGNIEDIQRIDGELEGLKSDLEAAQARFRTTMAAIADTQGKRDALVVEARDLGLIRDPYDTATDTFTTSLSSHVGPCLRWTQTVELTGTVEKRTFPGRPNFESIADGDEPETWPILKLDKPICIDKGTDELEPAVWDIKELQVTNFSPSDGKATISGKLFHSENGHHHTQVLIWTGEGEEHAPEPAMVTDWEQARGTILGLVKGGACMGTPININDKQVTCSVGGQGGHGMVFRLYAAQGGTSERADRQVVVLGSVSVEIPQRIFAREDPASIQRLAAVGLEPLGLSSVIPDLMANLEGGKSYFTREKTLGATKEVVFSNDIYGIYGQTYKYTLVWNCNGGARLYRPCAPW